MHLRPASAILVAASLYIPPGAIAQGVNEWAGDAVPTGLEQLLPAGDGQSYAGVDQSSSRLADKLQPGARIFVTDRNGTETAGRFLRLSADDLTLLVDGHERALPFKNIGRVEKRDALWNGMLMGAAPSAVVAMAGAGASCSPNCARDVTGAALVFGGIGAGLGALIDFGVHGHAIVDGPNLPSAHALRTPQPVTSLGDLWMRVRKGDTIDVFTRNGQKVTGTFVSVSGSAVTIAVSGSVRDIQSVEVRRVTRTGNRYRGGALWGGILFGALGLAASASCSGGGCGDAGFVALFTGTSGALWGAGIGAMIPRHPTIYQPVEASIVRAVPVVNVNGVGVALSLQF